MPTGSREHNLVPSVNSMPMDSMCSVVLRTCKFRVLKFEMSQCSIITLRGATRPTTFSPSTQIDQILRDVVVQ